MKATSTSPALLWTDHEASQELHTQNDKFRGGKQCQMIQWPLHQPQRKCPQWQGSTENWREPRSPTSHTVKAFNTRQSCSLVRGSYWYLWLRRYSVSIDLLWSLANNDSLHLCSFALYHSTHASPSAFLFLLINSRAWNTLTSVYVEARNPHLVSSSTLASLQALEILLFTPFKCSDDSALGFFV